MKAQLPLIAFTLAVLVYTHRGMSQSYATGNAAPVLPGTVAGFGYSFHAGK
jgi:hypothetical protein